MLLYCLLLLLPTLLHCLLLLPNVLLHCLLLLLPTLFYRGTLHTCTIQTKDGAEVTMCEFQDGITLPQFKVTTRVLQALGLYSEDDKEVQVQYFNTSKSRWCTGPARACTHSWQPPSIAITPEFDEIFKSNSLHAVPNICTNLKAEHAAVHLSNTCKQLRAASIVASDSEEPEDMRKQKHLGHLLQGNTHHAHTNTASSSAVHPYSPQLVTLLRMLLMLMPSTMSGPVSFYACEIADGFKKYDKFYRVGLSSHVAFSLVFGEGVHFHLSTFSKHQK
ncbi:uncharacterized protein EDB93DRAFT_1105682 [Suillus bovinus]|uniref:uncharacterized protein n=1 Tax=Suillus bovinus TaxID=48563 RepID=UPI001B87F9A9|nr:uncharacterized protein EDB93DRAFT_1105682 [Suillus bovinus]KAG2141393.1 hypothetical protein EDB93DRAFT_1105682 [Suillus bovinus]